jgi:23S rRNA (uracil1939-C5)-methyltransferase
MYQKNDELIVTIEDQGINGEGIGKENGYALFVKDSVIGDKCKVKIMKAKKNYAYAHLEEVTRPSEKRAKPACAIARACGGCQIQELRYEDQLIYKQKKVFEDLVRIGEFEEGFISKIMEPIVGMDSPFRYRGKAQFPIGRDSNGKPVAGFYAGRTHSIIKTDDCVIGVEENKDILKRMLSHMEKYDIAPYDEATGKGLVRHELIRKGIDSSEIMVCIVINGDKIPYDKELVESLRKIEGMTSVSLSHNKANTNVIMGEKITHLWGDGVIHDTIYRRDVHNGFARFDKGIRYSISPLSFYQVNPEQTEKLYSIALDYADLTGNESVWDLYCGIGTISLFLAGQAKQVYGVEIVPQAIDDAKANACANGINNAEFFVGKAEEVLPAYYSKEAGGNDSMKHPDVIVVDPPRKGCDEECLSTMLKMKPDRIVYVSCDPATLSRDLKYLVSGGYELKKVRPVDMFPHSVHVETVVLLSHE